MNCTIKTTLLCLKVVGSCNQALKVWPMRLIQGNVQTSSLDLLPAFQYCMLKSRTLKILGMDWGQGVL